MKIVHQGTSMTKMMKKCANINQMNSLQCGNRVLGAQTTIIESAHSIFILLGELLTKLKMLVLSNQQAITVVEGHKTD